VPDHRATESFEDALTDTPSRRAFLAYASGALSLVIGGLLAIPLVGFVLAPVFRPRKSRWVQLGHVADLPRGIPTKLVYSYPTTDGWLSKVARGTVYALTEDGQSYTVLSNICPHAGCGVRWDEEKQYFQCPCCQDGRFDRQGKVISGPPPGPLKEFAHKVDGGSLLVELEEGA
jgi:Rieske Fe-S protein